MVLSFGNLDVVSKARLMGEIYSQADPQKRQPCNKVIFLPPLKTSCSIVPFKRDLIPKNSKCNKET
jgi:hypothetical protein